MLVCFNAETNVQMSTQLTCLPTQQQQLVTQVCTTTSVPTAIAGGEF